MRVFTNIFFALIFFVTIDILFFGGHELEMITNDFLGTRENLTTLLGMFVNDIRYASCRQIGLIGPSCSVDHIALLL